MSKLINLFAYLTKNDILYVNDKIITIIDAFENPQYNIISPNKWYINIINNILNFMCIFKKSIYEITLNNFIDEINILYILHKHNYIIDYDEKSYYDAKIQYAKILHNEKTIKSIFCNNIEIMVNTYSIVQIIGLFDNIMFENIDYNIIELRDIENYYTLIGYIKKLFNN